MAKETQTPETPTTRTLSISGLTFEVAAPYVEGHAITAAEANALNQMRKENIANNTRKRVNELKGDADEFTDDQTEQAAAIVAEVDAEYVFTMSSGGSSRSRDPFEIECTRLAREYVNGKIQEQGSTIKAYKEADGGKEKYDELVAQVAVNEAIQALAKENIEQRKKLADIKIG